jgi:hypothetical protein
MYHEHHCASAVSRYSTNKRRGAHSDPTKYSQKMQLLPVVR